MILFVVVHELVVVVVLVLVLVVVLVLLLVLLVLLVLLWEQNLVNSLYGFQGSTS